MKKLLSLLLFVSALLTFSSCGDDEPKGGISGVYYTNLPGKDGPSHDWTGKVYNFVNDNTVVYYNYVADFAYWTGYSSSESLSSIGLSGYYCQQGCGVSYTYNIIDNKVYIPMQGVILTIDGKNLRQDGSSSVWKKL